MLALAQIIGVHYTGHTLRNLVASYARVEDPESPLVSGLGDTRLIPNQHSLLMVEPDEGTRTLLTLVPTFAPPSGVGAPPERASIPTPQTSIPVALARERRVYFANEIGKLAWQYKLPDHADLIANAVRMALPEPLPVEVEAPHGVQVSVFRQESRLLVHLVSAWADRPRADTVPIHDVRVRVRPDGARYRRAQALALAAEPQLGPAGDEQETTLPCLDTWEIVAFEA